MDKRHQAEKIQKVAASVFISSMFSLAILIMSHAAFEKSPLIYKNLPFPVVNQVIRPGDTVPIKVDRCNKTSGPTHYTITRYLLPLGSDRQAISLGKTDAVFGPGCRVVISEINRLPHDIPPGRYKIYGTAEVRGLVNPMQVEWYTVPFFVSSVK